MEQENLSPRYRRPGEVSRAARGRTASGGHRERQSTEAGHRDGTARSSEEGPVMGLERRATSREVVYEKATSRIGFYLTTTGLNCHATLVSVGIALSFPAGGQDFRAHVAAGLGPFA